MTSQVSRIAELAQYGERMFQQLRKKASLTELRKGLAVRYGIAEAAALLGCSTNRIRMVEEDGRLSPPPPTENHRRPSYSIEDMLNMRVVHGASLALGTVSLAVMQAANALLVPLAATNPDFSRPCNSLA